MKWWHGGVVAAAVALVGGGWACASTGDLSGSSLDAGERAVVEEVERGSFSSAAAAARFVDENVAVLLSEGVAGEVDGADLAAVFEVALEGESADGLFETVVSAVAEEGEIHNHALRPVLGDAAAARLAWFDARINAFRTDNSDQWDELRGPYDEALRFLREAMRDPAVAERLRQSMADYGRAEVAAAPDDGRDRSLRIMGVGSFQAFFTLAYFEAEEVEARLDRSLDGVEDVEAADLERRREDRVDRAMWVALDRLASDPTVRAGAVGEPFADATGALKSGLTESETGAFEVWATNQALEGGLLLDDANDLAAGVVDVRGG